MFILHDVALLYPFAFVGAFFAGEDRSLTLRRRTVEHPVGVRRFVGHYVVHAEVAVGRRGLPSASHGGVFASFFFITIDERKRVVFGQLELIRILMDKPEIW